MVRKSHALFLAVVAVFAGLAPWPAQAQAQVQRRAVSRPARSVIILAPRYYRPAVLYPHYYFSPFYYPGYFYSPFYGPAYYGWSWYGQYPYPPYGMRRPFYDSSGSARIQVTPNNTEVYLDGYFAGVVDDFDGYLQRLHAPAGEHELTFYLEGHRTRNEKVLFRPRATLRIQFEMEPLAAGEAQEPRPRPADTPRRAGDPARRVPAPPYTRGQDARFGTLLLGVQPVDAEVFIDGERWDRPEGEARFSIDLPQGTHRVEVRKEGFRPYSRTIQIRPRETVTLNVSLTTGPPALL